MAPPDVEQQMLIRLDPTLGECMETKITKVRYSLTR